MDICPLKINSKNIECLGVNLQKEVNVPCNENLKSLKKEMEEDTENGEASHADGDKNQYYENNHSTKGNLQTQCNPNQNPNSISHLNRKRKS